MLIWLFFIVFLQKFYTVMKIETVKKSAHQIMSVYGSDNYEQRLDTIALDNEICIKIVDKYNRIIFSDDDNMGGSCLIHGFSDISQYIHLIHESPDGNVYYKIYNAKICSDTLLWGSVLKDESGNITGYLLINSTLEPVNSTVDTLKALLIAITAVLLIAGIFIAFIISDGILGPLEKITQNADKLAKGQYDVKFDGGVYSETTMLANTLNYAAGEISKIDTIQRDLIANVSHDLRTPLTMVKAYAEMIRDLSGDNPAKRNEHLGIIIEETDRLALLVSDMLDLSKLESGGQKLNISEFDISETLSDIIARYKGIYEEKGYIINFEPDSERFVKCDIVKIEQVIYNLINNAINYTGDDKNIFVKQINQSDGVTIEIRDTGKGIAEEDLKIIFDKYYRAEKTKRETVGTGLGLSIVKAILKKHNFPYGVKSVVNEGSVFWFKIVSAPPDKKV